MPLLTKRAEWSQTWEQKSLVGFRNVILKQGSLIRTHILLQFEQAYAFKITLKVTCTNVGFFLWRGAFCGLRNGQCSYRLAERQQRGFGPKFAHGNFWPNLIGHSRHVHLLKEQLLGRRVCTDGYITYSTAKVFFVDVLWRRYLIFHWRNVGYYFG